MATLLDFSKFTFSDEEVRSVNELVMDALITSPDLNLIHTIFPNIKIDKEVGFIGTGGLVGKARQGCDPVAQAWNIGSRMLNWTPADWEILIHDCYLDLKTTAAAYALRTGTAQPDFTNTDYMAIVVEVLTIAMKEMLWRIVWFSDTAAADITGGGVLTDGTDEDYFNLIDGLWKQMTTQVTANAKQKVTISENAGNSYANQALPTTNIQAYLKAMVYGAPLELRAMEGKFIACTQSFYDAYEQSLAGTSLESMYMNLTNGQSVVKFNGIPLIPIPAWDRMIATYYDNATTLYKPHRAVLTTKAVLGIGIDSQSELSELDIWYDKDTRKVKMEGMGTIDAKLMNPAYFMLAY